MRSIFIVNSTVGGFWGGKKANLQYLHWEHGQHRIGAVQWSTYPALKLSGSTNVVAQLIEETTDFPAGRAGYVAKVERVARPTGFGVDTTLFTKCEGVD